MKSTTPSFYLFSKWLFSLCLFAGLPLAAATDYYVSPSGNNGNPGTSSSSPWQNLAKVNSVTFVAGDRILFQCGQTFSAPASSDALIIKGSGSSDSNRIVYGSYSGSDGSTVKPIISQTTAGRNGVKFTGANDWVTLQDLEIAGPYAWSATTGGAVTPYGIYLQGSTADVLKGTTIRNVVVHNFQGSGIRNVEAEKISKTRIEYSEVYNVGDAGIRLDGGTRVTAGDTTNNLYIGHTHVHHASGFETTYDNLIHNGDGIYIGGSDNVLIEYCVVHDTATGFNQGLNIFTSDPTDRYQAQGGPVGMWFVNVHKGVMQFNEVYNCTKGSSSSDGGSIDLDGGSVDCIAQYNYTHDSDGAGYLLAHFVNSEDTVRNTFRYNISVNDSKYLQSGISIWSAAVGALTDSRFYNNLIVQTRASKTAPCLGLDSPSVANATNPVQIYNNIFITAGTHKLTNTNSRPNVVVKNNLWWSLDNNPLYYNGTTPSTLAAADSVGIQSNPLVANPEALINAPVIGIGNIDEMASILAQHFKVLSNSPAINTGRSQDLLNTTIDVGVSDFFRNLIPQDGAYDIGIHERAPAGSGTLSLASSVLSGKEGTSITVTVKRTGGSAGPASVVVTTSNGLAQAGSDYTAVSTTLSWTNGETADKTVPIPLASDALVEGDETFNVMLGSVSGAELGGTGLATATVQDVNFPTVSTYTNPLSVTGSDPFVTAGGDGKFYMFFTNASATASRAESTNLLAWSNEQVVYSVAGTQSPHVLFDPLSSEWWYFGNNEMAVSSSVTGTFSKVSDNWGGSPRHYFDSTGGGQSYVFTGNSLNRQRIERLSSPNYGLETVYPYMCDSWWGSNWEGPAIIKNGSTYYWFMSVNGSTSPDYRVAYATAPTVNGPWTMQTQENDAAILKRSNIESIYGSGHPSFFTDTKGTNWIYYQQKATTSAVADQSIALDPLWFDSTGVPHVRPTRGTTPRPGPNSLPSVIWPTVAGSTAIQAESYAGSSIASLFSTTVVGSLRNQAYLAYRNVDFGAGLNTFEASVATMTGTGTLASVEVHIDGVNGPLVGVLPVTATGGLTTFQTKSAGLYQTVSGVKDVFLVVHGSLPSTELLRLDSFRFTTGGTVNANHPPVAYPDTVLCARNSSTSVSLNVLANDTDPDGNTLEVTGAGNPTAQLRSFKASANNLTWNANGTVSYTVPSATFWGDDFFYYTVKDSAGGYKTGTVKVRVYAGAAAFADTGGMIIVEAENYADNVAGSDANGPWVVSTAQAGYAGTGYVTTADNGTSITQNQAYLDYALDVRTAGIYTVWARCDQPDANGNGSTLGFSTGPIGTNPDRTADTLDNGPDNGTWYWKKQPDKISLRPGILRMRLSRQDDGHMVDRFLLTTDANYDPNTVNGGVGPVPNAGTLALTASSATKAENATSVSFDVARTGGATGAATVNYATANGTALSGSDYTSTSGTLTWTDGDTASKTITIPLVNNTVSEPSETFTLALSGVTGAVLGSPASATITITDDDASFAGWSSTIAWNGGDSSAAGDPDGDGVNNLLEYALGGNPVLSGTAILPLVEPTVDDTRLQISFTRDASLTSLTYEVRAANELSGTWTTIAQSVNGAAFVNVGGGSFTVAETGSGNIKSVVVTDGTLMSANPRRFLRLRVVEGP